MEIICFHNPEDDYGCFSNWYKCDFVIDGFRFSSVEKYMMYRKAVCFSDITTVSVILDSDDPDIIKRLGRQVKNYNENIWNGVRQLIVFDGLMAKFSQNSDLKEILLSTGDAFLAEAAAGDKVWGIGICDSDPLRFEMSKWKGANLLGYSLMIVRSKLR